MRTRPIIAFAASLLVMALSAHAETSEAPGASCPGYRAELEHARAALKQRDGAVAIAALRRAQDALQGCIREEAGGRTLLASQTDM